MEFMLFVLIGCCIFALLFSLMNFLKYEKAIKRYMETDKNILYQENKKLKKQVQDLSDGLDDIQDILDDFEDENEKN